MNKQRILVIGAMGRLGSAVTAALRQKYGNEAVIPADINGSGNLNSNCLQLDVLDKNQLASIVAQHQVNQVWLLVAVPAAGNKDNPVSWKLNIQSLLNVLEVAKEYNLDQVFWPSSIAVFGGGAVNGQNMQQHIAQPATVEGAYKIEGEKWCRHYYEQYGLDVRSLRYPAIIYPAGTGSGLSSYINEMIQHTCEGWPYYCFLDEDACFPLIYLPDAARAAVELMAAPREKITIRSAYNIMAMSFAPCDIEAELRKYLLNIRVNYRADQRQAIIKELPLTLDDTAAKTDWGWEPAYNLSAVAAELCGKPKENGDSPSSVPLRAWDGFYPDQPDEPALYK